MEFVELRELARRVQNLEMQVPRHSMRARLLARDDLAALRYSAVGAAAAARSEAGALFRKPDEGYSVISYLLSKIVTVADAPAL
jgi:hypothetical protein